MILNPNSAEDDSLDKAGPFLPMLLNRPNIGTQMEVLINDTGKKNQNFSNRRKFDPAMDAPRYQIFMTWMESGFLDPIKVEREATTYSIPNKHKKDLDYERAYHVEEL